MTTQISFSKTKEYLEKKGYKVGLAHTLEDGEKVHVIEGLDGFIVYVKETDKEALASVKAHAKEHGQD